jgi:streptomycin 6-kinase
VFPRGWNASGAVLLTETFGSRIWKVRLADGTPAIVKDLKPFDDVEDELRGAHYLAWRDGNASVNLLGFEGRQMLLEYAGETILKDLVDSGDDRKATEIAAQVLEELLSPSVHPYPADLQPLRDRYKSLFGKAKADRKAGRPSLYVEAAEIAERLLSDPFEVKPLHGDLHHENILLGERGWLAIDPKGVLGDPGFDAANMFSNPLHRHELTLDPERIAHMAEVFGGVLGQPPVAILDHAIAWGGLSSSWHAEDRNETEENSELAVVAAIRAVRASF